MVWEAAPLPETKARLEKIGIRSVVFQPCGNEPATGNYLSVMEQNVENLRPIFTPVE